MVQQRLDAIQVELEEQLKSVEHQLVEHGASADPEAPIEVASDEGFADSGQAAAERSEIVALIEGLQNSHKEITRAIKRIDDGTYGKCENCGRDIPIERLEAIPTTSLCVECKQAGSARHK